MKLHKTVAAAIMILSSANLALAETDAHKTFEMLKGLEGNWIWKNPQGPPVEVTVQVKSGGSAILHEIRGKGSEDMITMIHLDGDRLLLTHYCGAANQPRMKVSAADAKSVSFEFVDGTNIAPGDGHMQRVNFAQVDADHRTEEWIFLDHGKETREVFNLERAK